MIIYEAEMFFKSIITEMIIKIDDLYFIYKFLYPLIENYYFENGKTYSLS